MKLNKTEQLNKNSIPDYIRHFIWNSPMTLKEKENYWEGYISALSTFNIIDGKTYWEYKRILKKELNKAKDRLNK